MPVTRGRPRAFDRDEALRRATELFWERGYETASIADLTAAMGIRPPSLYAAFGDKRALFDEVVAGYKATASPVMEEALAAPTAREALDRLLHALADDYTDPSHPPGCLVISAAVNVADGDVRASLRADREASKAAIADRIAADAGRLDEGTDPKELATFYAAVVQGMSTQACDGASREELHAIATSAMRAWPARP
ncbi:TetR/AcrR family transcriptional regulator [Phytomonospora endophytica]|uniref:AcrR family transcriptional regulator n=1 Tax=Phytomonospora endophytica TaxID=714109 RepID=A0A841FTZ7_9ACTN|nr:TetR/AcrR family transcriptional regulator [Phytomonospora endophytica]MBB6037208.1 AcrR family transcriptional regulator [Phytomonospora endophytica]GIG71291.1 TetR family transcriptional regulator [Phytomonospora endophytica]